MITDLEGEILSLPPGTHACLLHWTEDERRSTVEAFLRDGLALGDRCMLVVHEAPSEGGGAESDRVAGFADAIAAGALSVLTAELEARRRLQPHDSVGTGAPLMSSAGS